MQSQARSRYKNNRMGRGYHRGRSRGFAGRGRGRNQAKYARGKVTTATILKEVKIDNRQIQTGKRPLILYTDLDYPVDDQQNMLEDIRIGNPQFQHDAQLRTSNSTRSDERDREISHVKNYPGDLRGYIEHRKGMTFPENLKRNSVKENYAETCKMEDVRHDGRVWSFERRQEGRRSGRSDIISTDLYENQEHLATEKDKQHLDERNCPVDLLKDVRDDDRNSLFAERRNNDSQRGLYEDRKSYDERDERIRHRFRERDISLYRHEGVSDQTTNGSFGQMSNKGRSHGSHDDYVEKRRGREHNTERDRYEDVRVENDKFLHRRRNTITPDKDNVHFERGAGRKHDGGHGGQRYRYNNYRVDEMHPERQRFDGLELLRGRRDGLRSYTGDHPLMAGRDIMFDHLLNQRIENLHESDKESREYCLREKEKIHIEERDLHVNRCDGYHRDDYSPNRRVDDIDNGYDRYSEGRYLEKESGRNHQTERDGVGRYAEARLHFSDEAFRTIGYGVTHDSCDDRTHVSGVGGRMHVEELGMEMERREVFNTNTERGVKEIGSTTSSYIDEPDTRNQYPEDIELTYGVDHASRKRKRDAASNAEDKRYRKRKSRSEKLQKRRQNNQQEIRSSSPNEDHRFITEEYIEKANRNVLVSIGKDIINIALKQPKSNASFEYLCKNFYKGREFITMYCLKTFVETMFKDTIIEIKEDGIEIPRINLNICPTYTKTLKHDHVCKDLHLCKFFMIGRCHKQSTCQFSHDIRHARNAKVLENEKIDKLPDCVVLELCRHAENRNWTTLPIVCKFYNNEGGCKNSDKCQHLHVCKYFIEDGCKFRQACKRNHHLLNSQSRYVLDNFGLDVENIREEDIKKLLHYAIKARQAFEKDNGSESPSESLAERYFRQSSTSFSKE